MRYSVFHEKNPMFGIKWMGDAAPKSVNLADFDKVAEVDCTDLEDVFRVTNNIDTDWQNNPEVKWSVKRARSTSVGDVVITSDGKAFLCDHVGWVEVRVEDSFKEWKRVWESSRNSCSFEDVCDHYGSERCNLVNPDNAMTENDCGF